MGKLKLGNAWSCCDFKHHEHKTKIGAAICGMFQKWFNKQVFIGIDYAGGPEFTTLETIFDGETMKHYENGKEVDNGQARS